MLYDNHGRKINYLRIAVTDRCNLRCHYCMPEEGITYVDRSDLLTFEELERIVEIFAGLGINKVRITGGEPFLRKGLTDFISRINSIEGVDAIHITTNGTLTKGIVPQLSDMGIKSVNLSLDSIDAQRFYQITRRDSLPLVMDTLEQLIDHGIQTKINMVVMAQHNVEDILPMAELARDRPISVRFLEEMPFNGSDSTTDLGLWDYVKIQEHLESAYPDMHRVADAPSSTSMNYHVDGFAGTLGIIASYTRSFCGSCNRIRLTPTGVLKTCLYDDGVFNIRDLIRSGATDEQLITALQDALSHRAKDGYEAERNRNINLITESMATIGG